MFFGIVILLTIFVSLYGTAPWSISALAGILMSMYLGVDEVGTIVHQDPEAVVFNLIVKLLLERNVHVVNLIWRKRKEKHYLIFLQKSSNETRTRNCSVISNNFEILTGSYE